MITWPFQLESLQPDNVTCTVASLGPIPAAVASYVEGAVKFGSVPCRAAGRKASYIRFSISSMR